MENYLMGTREKKLVRSAKMVPKGRRLKPLGQGQHRKQLVIPKVSYGLTIETLGRGILFGVGLLATYFVVVLLVRFF
jgi:hypothetical protein